MLLDTTESPRNEQSSSFITPSSEIPETHSTARVTDEVPLLETAKQVAHITSEHAQSPSTGDYEYYQHINKKVVVVIIIIC